MQPIMQKELTCFGFYGGEKDSSCKSCGAWKRCRAVLVSNGLDWLDEVIESQVAQLDDKNEYLVSDDVAVMTSQLFNPIPAKKVKVLVEARKQEEDELLDLLETAITENQKVVAGKLTLDSL